MLGIFINLIVGVILSVASTLAKQAFARKPQAQQRETGIRGSAQFGGKVPQYFLIGTVGDPGKFEYGNEWGQSGGAPNAYSVDVYSFGDLPITGITVLFVGGVAVPLSTSGHVLQGYPATGDKAGLFWAEFLNGNQTSASTYLTSKFASDPDRPWLSDMIGVGLPYLITTALWADDRWAGQITGTIMATCQGIKLYDPRKDSTAGGSGTQRWDDQSTWAFSDNSMVIIYNIERGIYYDGAHVWGGKKTAAEMPYEAWAAAMDACDQSIALAGGGTEKQFRGGRRIAFNERPGDVIREFLIGCNGRIVHCADGTVWPLVGVPEEIDFHFTDADVLATEPLGSIPFPNLDEIINGATATYREPSQAWEDKETAPYLRADLEEEDDGRQQIEGLDLGTTFSGTQAQRVLKAVIEEARRFGRHVVALPPEFAQFRPLQVGAWTSERFGYVSKRFLITVRTTEPFGNVIFGLQEIDPADGHWNPETDEQPLSFAPVVTNRPAPQEVSGPSVLPVLGTLAFDAFWNAPSVAVDVDFVRITYRIPDDDDTRVSLLIAKPDLLKGAARVPVPQALSGKWIEVQLEYIAWSGRPMIASAWMPVQIAEVKLGPNDIDIAFDDIQEQIAPSIGWMSSKLRELLNAVDTVGSLLEAQDLANFNDREMLRRSLGKKVGDLEASFHEIIEVALGPGGAISQSLTALYAAMGGNSAQVLVRFQAVATPEGVSARWAVQLSSDGSTFASAGIYLDLLPGGETRIVLDASQTVVSANGGADIYAVFDENGFMTRDIVVATLHGPNEGTFFDLSSGELQIEW